jgi:hypothetical protein
MNSSGKVCHTNKQTNRRTVGHHSKYLTLNSGWLHAPQSLFLYNVIATSQMLQMEVTKNLIPTKLVSHGDVYESYFSFKLRRPAV